MRATGIIRRIDDLGRVVIPKEIRRQMRISVGDPLEIYTDRDGCVIFKRYVNDELKPMGEGIIKALRSNGIKGSVYNYHGDKVAGGGDEYIDPEVDNPYTYPIKTDSDVFGYVVVSTELDTEDNLIVNSIIDLASAYLGADL